MAIHVNDQVSRRFLDGKEEPNKFLTPIEGYEEKQLVSLEESMQPIKSLVHHKQTKELFGNQCIEKFVKDLDRNIWIVKHNSSEPKDNLTQDESAAIRLYTMQWPDSDNSLCTVLNKVLRAEKRDILKPWFSYLKLILTALFKLPRHKGIIWRGIRDDVSDQYRENNVWWGFTSCTAKMGQIDQFLGRCGKRTMFMIDCINGRAIRNHSQYPNENEILLMSGSYFSVIDKHSPAEDLYTIHLQQMEPPYELLKPPFNSDLISGQPHVISYVGISSKVTTSSPITTIKSHGMKFNIISQNSFAFYRSENCF